MGLLGRVTSSFSTFSHTIGGWWGGKEKHGTAEMYSKQYDNSQYQTGQKCLIILKCYIHYRSLLNTTKTVLRILFYGLWFFNKININFGYVSTIINFLLTEDARYLHFSSSTLQRPKDFHAKNEIVSSNFIINYC